jgi:acetyl-CoA carboxylase biotin carboxyl carrier protein
VRDILSAISASDAVELELEEPGFRVRLRRRPGGETSDQSPGILAADGHADVPRDLAAVPAPLTGVFYASPSPGAPPFARPGDWIETGSVVGMIEAMKVFNEVTADLAGALVQVLVADGALVRAGDPLMYLDPTRGAPGPTGHPVA